MNAVARRITAKRLNTFKLRHEVRVMKLQNETDTELRAVDIQDINELIAEVEHLRTAGQEAIRSLLNICGADAEHNPDALHALTVLSEALKD